MKKIQSINNLNKKIRRAITSYSMIKNRMNCFYKNCNI